MKPFFYSVLLLALLGVAAWEFWGPPPAIRFARARPPSARVPTPANPPGPAAANVPSAPAQPQIVAISAPSPQPQASRLSAVELARCVTESQKQAVALYPALATPNSDFNARFVDRYQRWQAERSPRLQDPDWPMQLAVECASAAKMPATAAGIAPAAAIAPVAPTRVPLPARLPAPSATASTVGVVAKPPAAPPAAAPAAPADGGGAPLISLNVQAMNAGSTYNGRWLTYYYGYDVLGKANKALDLDARNLSAHASTVVLQWIFTVHTDRQGGRTIFDMGSGNWDMQPNQSTHFGVRSADLNTHAIWYYNYRRYYGSEFDGWLVIARYKDKVLKAVGSSSVLESLVGTPELATMVSAYQSTHPAGNPPPAGAVSTRQSVP